MPKLVALDLAGGAAFKEALQRVWDAGDVALPVDQRLPVAARAALLDALRPDEVVDDGPTERRRLDHASGTRAVLPALQPGDVLVVATSGTTGAPKGVVHTRAGVMAHAEAVHARLSVDPGSDRWLACLPLGHIGGLGVVIRSLVTGTPVDVVPGFVAADVVAAPDRLGTTLTSLVTTALDRIDPSRFRWIVLGGSADPHAETRPANVVATYGSTETGGGVVYGGEPLPGVEVRIDADGAISLRGPSLLRSYRDGTVPLVDGWLPTGDLGEWAPDGRLVVHGRADDVIVTGGENVWPEPVEAALRSHPAVVDVAVAGRPDPEWGQVVVAWIVSTDPAAPPALDDLRDHVKATLPTYCAPRSGVVVEALPRTALGKLRRAALPPAPG
ncbi:MAG TPA: AMP-binding protein [Acidimicrobiales bacterium]